MAVFGYTRVSTDRQADDGESLGVQRRQIEGHCMIHGLTVEAVFVEAGISASTPLCERPEGSAMMARLQRGDVVIASKLDRLFRSALDALQTVDVLKAKGVTLHLLDLGGDVMGNGLGKLFLTMASAFAEAERDRIRERIATVKADQKARGRYLGGKVPFGFVVDAGGALTPHEGQQGVIARVRSLRAAGGTVRAIATELQGQVGKTVIAEIIKAAA